MDAIKAVRGVLKKVMTTCRRDTLDQCGIAILHNMNGNGVANLTKSRRHREGRTSSLQT